METTKTITLTNFEIIKATDRFDKEYFRIIDRDSNEAYFCFQKLVTEGWNILDSNPSPINIEIEYEEKTNQENGAVYKRVTKVYTDDDIIV